MKLNGMLVLLTSALMTMGCASTNRMPELFGNPIKQSQALLAQGKHIEAIRLLKDAQQKYPENLDLLGAVHRTRTSYVRAELQVADEAVSAGDDAKALVHYNNVLSADAGNQRATLSRAQLERRLRMQRELAQAASLREQNPEQALETVSRILAEQPNFKPALILRDELLQQQDGKRSMHPRLADALRKPVSLNLRAQPLQNIFDVISRLSGVNFAFDADVQTSRPASLFAARTTAEDAINLLLRTNQLEKKILDQNTLLIYPANLDKSRNYKDFAVRTFYLSHADAKQVLPVVRQMVKPKDLYADERINALLVRDTPETILVAERVIRGLDVAQSEVTLDVQILELNTSDTLDLGVDYPGKLGFSVLEGISKDKRTTIGDLLNLNRNRIGVVGDAGQLSLAINMLQKNGKTKVLANPKIRVRNLEKANIKIGERLPVVTTSTINTVTTESVSQQEVGLNLKVEPRINLNDEVTVKINLEVSHIIKEIETKTGNRLYELGSRSAETVLTAKNGETQVLAGLIKRDEKSARAGLPGLSAIPGLGRIFGSTKDTDEQSEIVLLITPHIERNVELPPASISSFLSGTESRITTEALILNEPAPTSANTGAAAVPKEGNPDQPPPLDAPIATPAATAPQ